MRIISLAPSNTEILYALECSDEIVAVTRFCDYPEEAKLKPKVGGWIDIDDKLVEKYMPDVIMTSTFVQDKIVSRFKGKGIKIFHSDPKTLEQVYESIISIGELVDKKEKALEIVAKMKKEFSEISKPKEKIRVYCEEWHKPPTISGNWVPKIIEFSGGTSLCPEGKVSYPLTLQEVEKFNPDLIILSLCGFGEKAKTEIISLREDWHILKAVKENKIFAIDDSLLNRPGPRLVEGARWLAEKISFVIANCIDN